MSTRDLLRGNDERFLRWPPVQPDEWSRPSLCDDWSNHDVLAHLVIGYRAGPGARRREILRHGGSFDRANTAWPVRSPRPQPGRTARRVPRLVTGRRGLGRYFPPRLLLGDHITHELDMLFALDREPEFPPKRSSRCSTPKWRAESVRSRVPQQPWIAAAATDVDWTHGERADRRGPRRRTGVRAGQPAAMLARLAATASTCWRRGSVRARSVGPGDDLQVVPRRILEVDAAAAVVVVDLAGPAAPRIGPVLQTALADASVDRVELVLGHQERIVLRADVLVGAACA